MNTLKKKSFKSVYLPVDFFYSTTLSRNVKKKKKKKKSDKEDIECEIVEFDHVYKTNDDADFKIWYFW